MALGWGVVPYGTGDWGSEGAIIPGAGSVAFTGQAPQLKTEIFIQPDAGSLTATGAAPTLITGAVVGPGAGAVAFTGAVPTLLEGKVFVPGAGTLTLTGQQVGQALTVTPAANALSITGQNPAGFDLCRPQAGDSNIVLYRGGSGNKHRGCACFRKFNGLGADSGSSNNSHAGCRVGCINRPDARAFFWNTSHPSGGKFDANGGCTRYIEWTGSHTSIRNIKSCRRSACFKQSYTRKGPASDYG
jgi:hypothetical protein